MNDVLTCILIADWLQFEFPGAPLFMQVPRLMSCWRPVSKSWNSYTVIYKKIGYYIAVNVILYLKNSS